jgi:hypothetical protein
MGVEIGLIATCSIEANATGSSEITLLLLSVTS